MGYKTISKKLGEETVGVIIGRKKQTKKNHLGLKLAFSMYMTQIQYDSDPKHTAKATKEWLEGHETPEYTF